MPEITVNGSRAHYTTGGRAWEAGLPALVMVHGAGSNQSVWVLQSRALAHHGWNVAVPDLPGHGRSDDLPALDSVEGYLGWVLEFMAALKLKKAVLCGHSLGSAIALTLAAEHPGRVRGLALLSGTERLAVSEALLAATEHDVPRAIEMITAFSYDRGHHLGGNPNPGAWLMGGYAAVLAGCDPAVLHRDFLAADAWRAEPYLARVACPTLLLAGKGDRMVPPAQTRELAKRLPGAEFREILGAGHDLMGEAPRPVLKTLREFLAPFGQPPG